jgi:hypothetical protein
MADVEITITIPDAHVARAVELFNKIGDSQLVVAVDKHFIGETDLHAEMRREFPAQDVNGGETLRDYGKRLFTQLPKMLFDALDEQEDQEHRVAPAHAAIPSAHSDIPDDFLS